MTKRLYGTDKPTTTMSNPSIKPTDTPRRGAPTKDSAGQRRVPCCFRLHPDTLAILRAASARNPETSQGEWIDRAVSRWPELKHWRKP